MHGTKLVVCAVFGDALSSLLIFSGLKATREYYVNDAGGQVDVLARSAFLRYRGPILLALVLIGIAIQATLAALGRWRPHLYTVDLVHGLLLCGVLTWVIGAGPIFTATATDQAMKEWSVMDSVERPGPPAVSTFGRSHTVPQVNQ